MAHPPGPDSFRDPGFAGKVRARDPEAMRAVVHAYMGHILRAARGAGIHDDRAQDITQEVFKTFIETADRFEGRSHVRTWLFGILYHKISEARRDIGKENRDDDIDDMMEKRFKTNGHWQSPPVEADQNTWRQEISNHIDDCMEPLPESQRLAFVMREVEGMDSEEICNAIDVSRTNLGVLLYRARNSLRECLEGKGVGKGSA
jgi:RNA polymerase sigma-70 factor (ECF subfamily)